MENIRLSAGQYVLDVPQESDIPQIFTACQDPEIQRYTTVPEPYEYWHAEAFVRETVVKGWSDGTSYVFAIRAHQGGELRGLVGLHSVKDGSATIGYWIVPAERGRGVMTAAVKAVVNFAFDDVGLERIVWDAVVGNYASRKVAERCGFRVEGQIRGYFVKQGRREDAWLGTLLAKDPRPA